MPPSEVCTFLLNLNRHPISVEQTMTRAVIFDCDGVLVDSELLGNEVLSEVLRSHGLEMTPRECLETFMGSSMPMLVEKASRLAGKDLRRVCETEFLDRIAEAFETRLRAVEGIPGLVRSLGVPKAVASSSPVPRLQLSLRVTGMLSEFNGHVYSADHVARPKPAPDVFLLAAQKLAVAPDACVVVEDGVSGCRAAQAAGMMCVAFLGGGHVTPAHEAALRATGVQTFARDASELGVLLETILKSGT